MEIAQEINLALKNKISRQTVNTRLIDRNLCSYVAVRKPMLKVTDRIKRMKFCRKILSMSTSQLQKIIFSDASNFTVLNRKNRIIIRRHQDEKFHNRFIILCIFMFRSLCISFTRRRWLCWNLGLVAYQGPGFSLLYDGRMNQYNYIETVENALIPTKDLFFSGDNEWIFQQNNAPCYTATTVTTWLKDNQVNVPWPARSLDLNPIENVWPWIV